MTITLKKVFGSAAKRCAVVAGLLAVISPATAFEFNPYYATDLGPVNWTGVIFNPSISYDTVEFEGKAGRFLKDAEGIKVGAELGYDRQIGSIVVGVALDFYKSWADGGRERAALNRLSTDFDVSGTVRGRLGYSFGRLMVFGTGGLAYGRLKISDDTLGTSDSETFAGYTVGGGLEFAYNKTITIRADYHHVDYGDEKFSSLGSIGNPEVNPTKDTFSVGLVSRF